MTIEQLTHLLGWCSAINIVLLMVSSLGLVLFRGTVVGIHSKMFQLKEEDLSLAYFQYLARFKILIFVFNLTPYIALKIMGV